MPTVVVPSTERIVAAWLATIPGITPAMVATSLPTDTSTWASTGFLTVEPVGGLPVIEGPPVRRPLVQVSVWCVRPGAQRPPWGMADSLMELVMRAAVGSRVGRSVDVALSVGTPASTASARILSVWAVSEPRRLWSDDSSFAHRQVDLRVDWAAA
jgi:hypothetical protein